jgi:peptidoglycan/LPS O-acetylase OafA/YrhL
MDVAGMARQEKYFWLGSSLGCLLILSAAMASRKVQTVLNWRGMVFIGRVSYSVYLLQFVVILCLLPKFVNLLGWLGLGQILMPAMTLVASLIITIGLSAASHRYIEEPCIQLGYKWSTAIQRRLKKDQASFALPQRQQGQHVSADTTTLE